MKHHLCRPGIERESSEIVGKAVLQGEPLDERNRGVPVAVIDVGRDAGNAAALKCLIKSNGNTKETGGAIGVFIVVADVNAACQQAADHKQPDA